MGDEVRRFVAAMDTIRLSDAAKERLADALTSQATVRQETDTPSNQAAVRQETDTLTSQVAVRQETDAPSNRAAVRLETDALTSQAAVRLETDTPNNQAAVQLETDALTSQAAVRLEKETVKMKKQRIKRGVIVALAAALAVGALSAGAAYLSGRARSLEAELHMTDAQRQRAEESGLSSRPDARRTAEEVTSATENGVTVTAVQSIADNNFAMLSFRIDGLTIPEGKEPSVNVGLTLSNKSASWSGSFYDGIVSENGRAAYYDDGSPLAYTDDGGLVQRYAAEDGSLVYNLYAMGQGVGALIGQQAEVSFSDFGYMNRFEPVTLVKGAWNLRWTLTGSDELRTAYPRRPIGDSGAVLTEASISPISLRAVYGLSDEMDAALKQVVDDDEVVPRLLGVRTKDGAVYPYLYMGPGSSGIPGEKLYETRFVVDRILDPEEVDAFVFLKSYPEGENALTEENLYIVPLD